MKVREQEPDGFEAFWLVWRPHMRRNDGRGDARNTYRKHILAGAMPVDIIDGARAFLREMPERDKAYIPLAATWLNREAYLDWADREREYQVRLQSRGNVVSIKPIAAVLPATHFSRKWEEQKRTAGQSMSVKE